VQVHCPNPEKEQNGHRKIELVFRMWKESTILTDPSPKKLCPAILNDKNCIKYQVERLDGEEYI